VSGGENSPQLDLWQNGSKKKERRKGRESGKREGMKSEKKE